MLAKAGNRAKSHRPALLLQLVYWALVIVTFVILAYGIFTRLLNPSEDISRKIDVTRMALTVAAGFGGLVALVVAYRKQRDAEEGRFVERFGAAAEQLGHIDVAVRMAGVYAMAGIADRTKNKDQQQQCIDVLCGYLRLPYKPDEVEDHQILKIVRSPEHEGDHTSREIHYQYRQNDREVRLTIIRTITRHLQKSSPQSWSERDFDFTGAVFDGGDFSGAVFSGGTVSFDSAVFSDERVSFNEAVFSGRVVSFRNAVFSGQKVSFRWAKFFDVFVNFSGAKFSGEGVSFGRVRFDSKSQLSFKKAVFSHGKVDFFRTYFACKGVDFSEVVFSGGEVSLIRSTFSGGSVSFTSASFLGGCVNLGKPNLSGGLDLSGKANFSDTTLVDFSRPVAWVLPPIVPWADGESPPGVKPDLWPPRVAQSTQ